MKKALAFIFSLSGFLLLATPSFAVDTVNLCDSTGQFKLLCGFTTSSFGSILGQLLTLIFVVSIVAALFYLVWGGFKWLTSGGDKTAVGAAREHIIAAIVGLVVIFLSYFILNILVMFFTGRNLSDIVIPTLGTPSSTTCSDTNHSGSCTISTQSCKPKNGSYTCVYLCGNAHHAGWCPADASCEPLSGNWRCIR